MRFSDFVPLVPFKATLDKLSDDIVYMFVWCVLHWLCEAPMCSPEWCVVHNHNLGGLVHMASSQHPKRCYSSCCQQTPGHLLSSDIIGVLFNQMPVLRKVVADTSQTGWRILPPQPICQFRTLCSAEVTAQCQLLTACLTYMIKTTSTIICDIACLCCQVLRRFSTAQRKRPARH
jgi:hypothetical protein